MKHAFLITSLGAALLMASCSAPKKVPYMVDAETIPAEVLDQINPFAEPIAMPGDLLNIDITSSNMDAVMPFNKNKYVSIDGTVATNGGSGSTQDYLVNNDGDIEFPIIGKLHVGGLNKSQIADLIKRELCPKYLREEPTVDIRFKNFHVTMLGAVGNGIVTSDNERLNILEAVAKSGDLNIKGKRENIMLIRTHPDGHREIARLNIHDKSILTSPYYNLQQNDIIYVEPNRSMADSAWTMPTAFSTTLTVVAGISSIIGLAMTIITLTKVSK
ncbi:MAG: polysaccharide biosynthesis/export family protein [Muribaculaceae bacterium]